ncbi:hypothetical protein PR202_gb05343 [Eleusine coracana subsp. coracana]|uniref:Trichome birefringence-like N-terminal domain-containing protein n=1 Tax=Eleusine coracana subsp. coracana TaxID=191504 RepID=A0AAV5E536_ELECO|nr:hypothetical protein QOZ80_1BG0077090 [Eleusine coracana subsp. coracana]GJN18204.1 hypothetical protein PR202_gb05343 [Eleusine coracana subsp. coracana]
MVLSVKVLFGPAVAIFLSAIILLSCFTNLIPYLSYYTFLSSPYISTEPVPKCDIFRGEWVPDPSSPLYTNETCAYIQNHQNCLMYGRPDLEFLKWRWKPDGCDLPRFDPHKFFQVVGNKTLAFVGDSLARNHYQSLLCLLSKVALPKDLSNPEKPHDGNKIMFYEAYNFTIYTMWSPFLVRFEEIADGMFNLYLDEPGEWLPSVPRFDYLILSAANWFTRQTYFYERGQLVGGRYVALNITTNLTSNRYSHRMAFRTSLRALNGVGFRGKVIVRTVSPMSHFEGGAYDKGGDCPRKRPYWANETAPMSELERDFYNEQVEEFNEAAARGMDMVLMDPTIAMLKRPDGHPSRYGHWPDQKLTMYNDCIHWCLPGPIDAWNDMLLHILAG